MESDTTHRRRIGMLLAAVAISIWGIVGFVDGLGDGYTNALFEPNYVMGRVEEGGPLYEAGFQPGDSAVSVEGIPIVDLGMYSRWPNSLDRRPGESLTLTVERDGELVSGEVVFRETPTGTLKMRAGGTIIAFSFLWFGIWALLTVKTPHAQRLAAIGLVLALGIPGPDMGSWSGVVGHLQTAATALWTLLLLRFFLLFPKPKRMGTSRLATGILYAAWVGLLFCFVLELIYHPRFYHSFGSFNGLVMLAYSALAIAAVIHTVVTTPRAELRESGMGMMFLGVLVAVLGTTIGFVDWAFLWTIQIPGSNWFPLTIAAVPLTMAMAVRKHSRSETAP